MVYQPIETHKIGILLSHLPVSENIQEKAGLQQKRR